MIIVRKIETATDEHVTVCRRWSTCTDEIDQKGFVFMYCVNNNVPNDELHQNDKEKFLEALKTAVEKCGVPENLYADTGKAIIMANNTVTAIPSVENAHCKDIEKYCKNIKELKTEVSPPN